jgi:hypothetical protein
MTYWTNPRVDVYTIPDDPNLVVCPFPQAPSADVEMTAYALLAYTTSENEESISNGLPIVKWLSKQRNAYGGFASTQVRVSPGYFSSMCYAC